MTRSRGGHKGPPTHPRVPPQHAVADDRVFRTSPEWVDGLRFDHRMQGPHFNDYVKSPSVFWDDDPDEKNRQTVIRHNYTIFLRVLVFLSPFLDLPCLADDVARLLDWPREVPAALEAHLMAARANYIQHRRENSNISEDAELSRPGSTAATICSLIDRLKQARDESRKWLITRNRVMRYWESMSLISYQLHQFPRGLLTVEPYLAKESAIMEDWLALRPARNENEEKELQRALERDIGGKECPPDGELFYRLALREKQTLQSVENWLGGVKEEEDECKIKVESP